MWTLGIFDMVDRCFGRAIFNANFAFRAGSSKHGKALRASVAWNCVEANHLRCNEEGENKMITFTLSSQVWVAEDGENHLPGLIAHLIGTAIESLHSVLY